MERPTSHADSIAAGRVCRKRESGGTSSISGPADPLIESRENPWVGAPKRTAYASVSARRLRMAANARFAMTSR
jgi:hypothetical protein